MSRTNMPVAEPIVIFGKKSFSKSQCPSDIGIMRHYRLLGIVPTLIICIREIVGQS
jgi:hypothetical protein